MSQYVVECDLSEEMKISVIIPIYNVSAYIERCIRSVMNQTFSDFECILVDDATPDDCVAKCEKMIAEYDGSIRFRMIHHEHNRGLSAARNTGTDAATGDYILYIDSDDAITNDCIEKLMTPIIRDNTIDIVMGNEKRFSGEKVLKSAYSMRLGCQDLRCLEEVRDFYFSGRINRVNAWNRLIRKDFLCQNGISFKEGLLWEDNLWTFYVLKHLKHLYIIEDVTYLKYLHPGSITTGSNLKTRQDHWAEIYHDISNNFTPYDSHREAIFYVKGFCNYYIDCGHHQLYQKAAQNFKRELSINHDTALYLQLLMVSVLSKTWMGRKAFHGMRCAYRLSKKGS